MTLSVQQTLDQAATLHRAGRLVEAERLYRQFLTMNPSHADSLHLLGVIAHQCGRSDLAVDLIGKAISVNDRSADFRSNIGTALDAVGRFDDAEAHYERAIVLNQGMRYRWPSALTCAPARTHGRVGYRRSGALCPRSRGCL
jgi:protein O-GlcNAc transferase